MTSATSIESCQAGKLLALLNHSDRSSRVEIALGFKTLQRLLESLPLTTEEFVFAHNWLCSAEQMFQTGERRAARYQVNQVVKRLSL
jgi:hypothetical protein